MNSRLADVWYSFVDFQSAEEGSMRALLSSEEIARLERRPKQRGRAEFLVGHALVRVALSQYADVPPARWQFEADANGRPEIAAPRQSPALRFNLSHTRGLVACAITRDRRIGIDVESTTRRVLTPRLASRVLCESEREDVEAQPESERGVRLLEYWTLKEAHLKALGTGLRKSMRDIEFCLEADGRAHLVAADEDAGSQHTWHHLRIRPDLDHVMAIAFAADERPVFRCREWRPNVGRVVAAGRLD